MRLLTENNFRIDPERIEDYIALDGYQALAKALFDMTAEGVIEEVNASGLRGRGGAGFPTGKKWELCREARGHPKYIICNADEGDPGAYMDRSLLEGNPHSVIEGMIIGAYAIGAAEGYIYVRMEYPAGRQARHPRPRAGPEARPARAGTSSARSSTSTSTSSRAPGAFVSRRGDVPDGLDRGAPGHSPPAAAVPRPGRAVGQADQHQQRRDLGQRPLDPQAGAPNGSPRSGRTRARGRRSSRSSARSTTPGLVEVPMGITLREIIYDIGGGIKDGKAFKAVQTGGPSGGCLPAGQLDLPIDYDSSPRPDRSWARAG